MDLKVQKRIASEVLKCGKSRVRFDPEHLSEVSGAITREDIRHLIKKGFIKKKQIKGVSRVRARKIEAQKKKGRRKGPGKRKGTRNARVSDKEKWIKKIRAQRKFLKGLRDNNEIEKSLYRKLYRRAKGGIFRSKAHIKTIIEKIKERRE